MELKLIRKTARYFEMASNKGEYAQLLYNGDGFQINKKKSGCYFKIAADEGYIKVMCKHADMLKIGDGLLANVDKSAHYYIMVADNDDPNRMFGYAEII